MDVQAIGELTIVTVPQRVDATSARDVESCFSQLLESGKRAIVADFGGNDYISSAGLRVFLAVLKFLEKNDGRIALCAMKPFVADVFDISGFSELFPVFATRDEAIAALS